MNCKNGFRVSATTASFLQELERLYHHSDILRKNTLRALQELPEVGEKKS